MVCDRAMETIAQRLMQTVTRESGNWSSIGAMYGRPAHMIHARHAHHDNHTDSTIQRPTISSDVLLTEVYICSPHLQRPNDPAWIAWLILRKTCYFWEHSYSTHALTLPHMFYDPKPWTNIFNTTVFFSDQRLISSTVAHIGISQA